MKRLVFLIWLGWCALAFGGDQGIFGKWYNNGQPAAAGGTSYILNEGFENSANNGFDDPAWTRTYGVTNNGGTAIETTNVLEGSRSLVTTNGSYLRGNLSVTNFEVDFSFRFQIRNQLGVNATAEWELQDVGGDAFAYIYLRSDGTIRFYQGTQFASTTATYTTNTTYIVWGHAKNDGTGDMEFAPYTGSQTRPTSGSAYCAVTSGGSGAGAYKVWLASATNLEVIFDHVRITSGPTRMGDDPP